MTGEWLAIGFGTKKFKIEVWKPDSSGRRNKKEEIQPPTKPRSLIDELLNDGTEEEQNSEDPKEPEFEPKMISFRLRK